MELNNDTIVYLYLLYSRIWICLYIICWHHGFCYFPVYYSEAALKQTHCIMHYINKGDLTCFDSDQYQSFFTKVLFPLKENCIKRALKED